MWRSNTTHQPNWRWGKLTVLAKHAIRSSGMQTFSRGQQIGCIYISYPGFIFIDCLFNVIYPAGRCSNRRYDVVLPIRYGKHCWPSTHIFLLVNTMQYGEWLSGSDKAVLPISVLAPDINTGWEEVLAINHTDIAHWQQDAFALVSLHNFISFNNLSNRLRYFNEKPPHNNRKCGSAKACIARGHVFATMHHFLLLYGCFIRQMR